MKGERHWKRSMYNIIWKRRLYNNNITISLIIISLLDYYCYFLLKRKNSAETDKDYFREFIQQILSVSKYEQDIKYLI